MLRKFKNSSIALIEYGTMVIGMNYWDSLIQCEKLTDTLMLVEYANDFDSLIDFKMSTSTSQSEEQQKIAEYRAITLNTNAFNGKWGGKTLGELFDANDREFIEKAIKEMKNEYIREKIVFLEGLK